MKAEEIKALRAKLGITAQELGELLGVTENTVNRWETGWRQARGAAATLMRQMLNEAKRNGKVHAASLNRVD